MDQAFSNLASACPLLASGAHSGDRKLSRAESTVLQRAIGRKYVTEIN